MKETIIRKLTSRKFWAAIAMFVVGILMYCGHTDAQAGKIEELIMSGAAVIAYIVGEGLTDAARESNVITLDAAEVRVADKTPPDDPEVSTGE